MAQSHHHILKCKNLENVALCVTTPEMKKSGELGKHKENIVSMTLESNKAEVNLESVSIKRDKITGRSLGSPYKRLRHEETVTETLFTKDQNYGLLGICIRCSKEKRISYNSQEKEFYSHNAIADIKLDGSTCKKFGSMEEGTRSQVNDIIKQLEINYEQRMYKLTQKQQQKSEEFHRVWEEKRLRIETVHKLEADMIRHIYNEGPATLSKLKTLDSNFDKIMEQNNRLKEVELEDLEMRQLAARNVLREKQDNWLAKARAVCDSVQTLQSDEDDECGCVNMNVSEGSVCDEMQSIELKQEVPIKVPEITDYVDPVEVSNASDKGDAIIAPDKLMNQRVDAYGTNNVGIPLAGQILEEVSPNHCSLPPVPEDQIYGRLASDGPEVTIAPVLEGGSLHMKIANSSDDVAPVHCRVEAQTIKNWEPLPLGLINVSPSSKLSPAVKVDHQNHDSGRHLCQTAESAEALVLAREPSSQMEEAVEIQNNDMDLGSGPEDQMLQSLASANLQDRDAIVQVSQGNEENVLSAFKQVGALPIPPTLEHPQITNPPLPAQPNREEFETEEQNDLDDGKTWIAPDSVLPFEFNLSTGPSRVIGNAIRSKYEGPWICWKEVPDSVKDKWFQNFGETYKWMPWHQDAIRKTFDRKAKKLLINALSNLRNNKGNSAWVTLAVREQLNAKWTDKNWKDKSKIAKENRAANKRASIYTGGSISIVEHNNRLSKELLQQPNAYQIMERTKRLKSGKWACAKAAEVSNEYNRLRNKGTSEENSLQASNALFLQLVGVGGGTKKGKVWSQGNLSPLLISSHTTDKLELDKLKAQVVALTSELESKDAILVKNESRLKYICEKLGISDLSSDIASSNV